MTLLRGRREAADLRIFLSYRRDDAAGHAGRLHDALLEHFRRDQIFMDIDAIEPGLDFVESIERALSQCDVLLVLIGPRWLAEQGSGGRRRLDDPGDFVRLEVQAALSRGDLRVVPVLIQGAQMPAAEDLPDELRSLVRRNALEVSDTRWGYDVSQLIELLKRIERAKRGIVRPVAAPGLRGDDAVTVAPRVRFRPGPRLGAAGALAGLGIIVALLALANARLPATGGGASSSPVTAASLAGPSGPSREPPAGPSAPGNSASASLVSPSSTISTAVASSPVLLEGATVATFEGDADTKTATFTVDESWSMAWTSEAYFSVFVSITDDSGPFQLSGLRANGSRGVTPMYSPGTFYLTVIATGPWTVTVNDMPEWPRATLPYSLTGEGSLNTPSFEQAGTTRVCWESDGDSTFIVKLWSLSGRGSESDQSAVIESGATEGCADLEARSKEGYLEVFTNSGTWTVSAQVK